MPCPASESRSMKGDSHDQSNLLNEIRNDHDLISRLSITPQELEALSKCALLGTLTCKQDMLFILRQIREATSSTIDHTTLFPKPPEVRELNEDSAPSLRGMVTHRAAVVIPEPESVDSRRRLSGKFGVVFWVVVLAVGLVWNGVMIMSRWRDSVLATVTTPVSQAASSSNVWYDKLDHLNVLLFWEVLIVGAIAFAIHFKSQRDSRRFKVRPGRRQRQ
jgi:hypothetical protein